jgi:type III secretion system FlhB-like substrate exporter
MQSVSISETQYLFRAMNKTGIKNQQESNMYQMIIYIPYWIYHNSNKGIEM